MFKRILNLILPLSLGAALFGWALELQDVRLVGLFKDTAVLQINNQQRILKVGKISPEGVKLIATGRNSATLQLGDRQWELALSRAVARYAKQDELNHIIAINPYGQYFTQGSINGRPVQLLVDTGATAVAMNTEQARRLNIDFTRGKEGMVSTAGGLVKAYGLVLDRVKVGGIEVRNVEASVLEGVYPTYILLGMTYLKHVKLSENNGVMTLTKKY